MIRKLKNQAAPLTLSFLTLALATSSFAALPPKYLGVKDFDKCLSELKVDTYSVRCMPSKKPKACPSTSWKKLNNLSSAEKLLVCDEKPNK